MDTFVHEGQHESDLLARRIALPTLADDNQRAFAEARAFRREAEYAHANNLTGTFAYRFNAIIRDEPETALESIITSYGLNVGDDEFRSIHRRTPMTISGYTGYTVAESVRLHVGDLLLLQKMLESIPAYEDPSLEGFRERALDERKGERIVFVSENATVSIAGLDDLRALIRRGNVRLETESQGQEKALSVLMCHLLDLGTVIVSARRYVALERRHGIHLDDNQPRIVGGQLQFLCRRFGFTELDAPLKEVRLDLTTLDCEVRVVPVAAVNATALP